MTDLRQLTPHELLDRVENRNRRFKTASIIFGAVLTAGLAILLVIGLITLQGVNSQLAQQKRLLNSQQQILARIQASSQQRTRQINDLQQHIDCIVELFQQPNRQNLKISDLEGCQITADGSVRENSSVGSSLPQSSNSGAAPQQSTTSSGSSNTAKPVAPPAPAPSSSGIDRVPVLGRVFKTLGL